MKSKKVLTSLIAFSLAFVILTVSVFALNWDGNSAGGSTNAVNGSSKGYVIRSTDDSACVVGYRFSVVDSSGNPKVSKVMDVYRNTDNGDNAYSTSAKFSVKYNKKQINENKNAKLTTTSNTTNCYKEKDMGFVSALPNPGGMEAWQKYEANINKILSKIGVGSTSNMVSGDKVIVEPLFDVCLAGEYQALTASEIAYCGRSVLGGSSNGGTSNGTSSTWGFIANYTNRIWPNKLYTPDGQGLWSSASKIADSTKATFDTILSTGYGAGIAYSETTSFGYTIAFNGNGATSGSTASMPMTAGVEKSLTPNGFVRNGYIFSGWNTKADGTGVSYTDKQTVKNLSLTAGATVTLYAQWVSDTFTVTYNANGGTGAPAAQTKNYGTAITLSSTKPTRTNYVFLKWNTKADGSGDSYNPGDKYTDNASVTLYAQWKALPDLSLEILNPNASYRETTYVITSYFLVNNSKTFDCKPSDNVSILFKVYNGNNLICTMQKDQTVCPRTVKNLYYFKWKVPEGISSNKVKITAELVQDGVSFAKVSKDYATIKYNVFRTPDTQYAASAPEGFTKVETPEQYFMCAIWPIRYYENGKFTHPSYGISIDYKGLEITPVASSNSVFENGIWTTKSGYGFSIEADVCMTGGFDDYLIPDEDSYTGPQYVVAKFPEFGFGMGTNLCRTLEKVDGKFVFEQNGNYGRTHFTPLWFPDGDYTVSCLVSDCWTPAGMLSCVFNSNTMNISGSAYDDWYIS